MKKILAIATMFTPMAVYAQETPPPTLDQLFGSVDRILALLLPIAGLISLVFVVIGGYMWMISAGDPSRTKQAQGTLTWALLGLVFILLISGILEVVLGIFS